MGGGQVQHSGHPEREAPEHGRQPGYSEAGPAGQGSGNPAFQQVECFALAPLLLPPNLLVSPGPRLRSPGGFSPLFCVATSEVNFGESALWGIHTDFPAFYLLVQVRDSGPQILFGINWYSDWSRGVRLWHYRPCPDGQASGRPLPASSTARTRTGSPRLCGGVSLSLSAPPSPLSGTWGRWKMTPVVLPPPAGASPVSSRHWSYLLRFHSPG